MIAAALLGVATPTPSPTGQPPLDADLVTPGLWGFVALFVLALAVYFLGRSMARRVRRVNQRAALEAEERALREAEDRERGGDLPSAGGAADDVDPGPDPLPGTETAPPGRDASGEPPAR